MNHHKHSAGRRNFIRNAVHATMVGASALAGAGGLNNGLIGTACAAQTSVDPTHLSSVTLRVARFKGGESYFFDDAGLANLPYGVNYSEFASGNLIAEVLSSGSVDLGPMSEIPAIFAIERAAPLKLIAIVRGDVNNQVVLVPKQSAIRSASDFRGKRIGYVRSTTSHYFLLRLLQEAGLSFEDIYPVSLSPQDGLIAFGAGQLDAWVIFGLSVQLAKQRTGARVLKTALGYLSGNYTIAATTRALEDPVRAAAISDYLRRQRDAYRWINKHSEPWAERNAQLTGASKELFLEQLREQSAPTELVPVDDEAVRSQQRVADVFAQARVLNRHVDVRPLWDRRFAGALLS